MLGLRQVGLQGSVRCLALLLLMFVLLLQLLFPYSLLYGAFLLMLMSVLQVACHE